MGILFVFTALLFGANLQEGILILLALVFFHEVRDSRKKGKDDEF